MAILESSAGLLLSIQPTLPGTTVSSDWKGGLPTLSAGHVTLRELELSDAASLLAFVAADDVARFISTPPTTIEGFERFIVWSHEERAAGRSACFAVVPDGLSSAIGIFQVRQLEPSFATAEWGFALGSAFWGTGVFTQGAEAVLDFAFDVLGVHRIEARSVVANGRGNGALRKLGAVCEAVTRRSVLCQGEYLDQHLWSILDSDWRERRYSPTSVTIH